MAPSSTSATATPGLATARDWLRFFALAVLCSSLMVYWKATALRKIPALDYIRFETRWHLTWATALWSVIIGTALAPLALRGMRRWLRVCGGTLCVWLSVLVIAVGGDWVRLIGLAILLPASIMLFVCTLTDSKAALGVRIAQVFGFFLGALFASPFVYAAWGLGSAVSQGLLVSLGVVLLWVIPLFLEGRTLDETCRALRVAPARHAGDEAVRGWKWLLLVLVSLPGGGLLASLWHDLSHGWRMILAMALFAWPLGLRSGRRGFVAAGALSLLLPVSLLLASWAPVFEGPILVGFFAFLGMAVLAAIAGRVEWRQRIVRAVAFGCAAALLIAIAAIKNLSESMVLTFGPLLCAPIVLLADRIQLKSRDADRREIEQLGRRWKTSFRHLVSRSSIEASAIVLLAWAAALPFVYVGSGFLRRNPCPDDPQCVSACCEVARPELLVSDFDGSILAVSNTEISPDKWRGSNIVPGGFNRSLRGALQYVNELSLLEGFEPCYVLETRGAVQPACSGYRLLLDSKFKSLGPTAAQIALPSSADGLDGEFLDSIRVYRKLTPAESERLGRMGNDSPEPTR